MSTEAQPQQKGGYIARAAAMLCQDSTFRLYLDRRCQSKFKMDIADGTHTEEDATIWLKQACNIKSRRELDHNKEAAQQYGKIMNHFNKWKESTGRQ